MSKKLIISLCALLAGFVFAGSTIASDQTITFKNSSPFTFTLSGNITQSSSDYCVDDDGSQGTCKSMLSPGESQRLFVGEGTGFNIGYKTNVPAQSNYYNLNIQNQQSGVSFDATPFPNTTTKLSDSDSSTIEFLSNKPIEYNGISTYEKMPYRGVNLSGAEASNSYLAEWLPSIADSQYFVNQGMNTIRVPVNWNYMMEVKNGNDIQTNKTYMDSIYNATEQLLKSGVNVVLDIHDYMRFTNDEQNGVAGQGPIVNPQQMGALWNEIAKQFKPLANTYNGQNGKGELILELMNEPHDMPTQQVLDNSNAAITSIRNNGINNLILIDGNNWTGLHSWTNEPGQDQITNADAFTPENIKDSANNYAIAVHQYFDANGSGTSPTCQTKDSFISYANFDDFMDWVHKNKVKVFLSEFGSGSEQNCTDDVSWLLSQMVTNAYTKDKGGFIGWTSWVAGHGWTTNDINNLAPDTTSGAQTSQMVNIYEPTLTKP